MKNRYETGDRHPGNKLLSRDLRDAPPQAERINAETALLVADSVSVLLPLCCLCARLGRHLTVPLIGRRVYRRGAVGNYLHNSTDGFSTLCSLSSMFEIERSANCRRGPLGPYAPPCPGVERIHTRPSVATSRIGTLYLFFLARCLHTPSPSTKQPDLPVAAYLAITQRSHPS